MRKDRTLKWLYQGRRVLTMAAGGGAEAGLLLITIPSGTVAELVSMYCVGAASAGATLTIQLRDEDNAVDNYLASVAAGASREVGLPAMGTAVPAHQNIINSTGLMLGPGMTLRVSTSAMANAETLTVSIKLLCSTDTEPTWATTGSGGTPTFAANTISTPMTPVVV